MMRKTWDVLVNLAILYAIAVVVIFADAIGGADRVFPELED